MFSPSPLEEKTFYIQSGKLIIKTVEQSGKESGFEMLEGDVLEMPLGLKHQFTGVA